MKDTSKIVLDIISNIVLKKKRKLVKPEAKLREDLGLDSIKMIAISAMLIESGIDVNSTDNNVDLSRIETIQDVIDIADEIVNKGK
ncbi:hypothetical protein [Vallitalea guaymasensis]|uniref:Carrier domain-containing protein n=1 Tax=Vallitalea guaymasensis TaxID=1185412 RepID=A0A8J8SCW5_9FIRM|nr:hypothetical protein [Vallitalea guaymasensis]QUH29830.1 hypothetical protein HYG85_13290 [Vallitalea guaymasensis]